MKKRVLPLSLLTVILLFIEACSLFDQNKDTISTLVDLPIQSTTTATAKIVEAHLIDANAISMIEKSSGYCKALVPLDWSFTSVSPYVGADAWSADQSSHAAWGIAPIYYALYPTPEAALTYLLTAVGYQGFQLSTTPVNIGNGFMSVDFITSIGRKGKVIYKVYDMDPSFFVISVYLGATVNDRWEAQGAQAVSAAISIRCVSQLRPSTSGVDLGSADPSSNSDNPEVDLSEEWSEAILGFENVYSPTTGDHYMAPLDSYWATGPDGGGYYRELPGGGYELLKDGFGDY